MTPTLILIDGSGFIFRAYHSLPPLTNPEGTPVGAVYGFVNMVTKLLSGHQASHIAVIFDAGRKTFRNQLYTEYKANRPPAPEDLIPQFPLVRAATQALNLPSIEMADYEADDIIATYTRLARECGMQVRIISSDKDLMQLVDEGVSMYDAMKQRTISAAEVIEKFGVPPQKVRDVLALIGDSSDNVPGVPSIGPKTAAELIQAYGDLEGVLSRISEIKQPKRREALEQNADKARLSYELVTLKNDVPNLPPLSDLIVRDLDDAALAIFLRQQGFKSLLARVVTRDEGLGIGEEKSAHYSDQESNNLAPAVPHPPSPIPHSSYTTITSESDLALWIAKATKAGHVAFDCETTSLNAQTAELVGFSLCIETGEACYVPMLHKGLGMRDEGVGKTDDLFSPMPHASCLMPNQLPLTVALKHLKSLLEDASVLKIGHNIKYDMLVMQNYGVMIAPVEDTMLLSYCLHAGEHGQGLDELCERYLGHKNISFDEVTGTGKKRLTFDEVAIDAATAYAAEDADMTLRLWHFFKPQLAQQKLLTLYETIERPLINVVAKMETAGIKVDAFKLRALSVDFEARMRDLEKEIMALAGVEFNVASPKQLGEVLFDHMKLEGGKISAKSGAYGTGNDVLEDLVAAGHHIARKVIEWRQYAKLRNTYCDTLPQQINPKTGRVHTNFALAIASTGRLSSSEPNLQNIPIRTEEGRKIREAFVAESGNVLLSADYSQIELRLLAHMADIPVLKAAFANGDDIHAITASEIFKIPLTQMTGDIRRRAKAINFGIIYGISAHGLAEQLGIGRSEAATIIEAYFKQYPGIRDFMEAQKTFARAHGYVETLYKRRCHVPMINDKNGARRQFAERAAINAPLQGTAADIIKRAMIAIDKGMRHEAAGTSASGLLPMASLLLQVHDELIFEVAEAQADMAGKKVKTIMENAAQLSVPLVVEVGVGPHWGKAH